MELVQKIKQALPENSVGRYDLLAIYKDAGLFAEIIDYLCNRIKDSVECVVSPEATGWPLAGAIANRLNAGFIGIRKDGNLPYAGKDLLKTSFTDYTGNTKTFAVPKDFMPSKSKVILVDDWVETGAQISAMMALVAQKQAIVEKIVCMGADTKHKCVRQWKDEDLLLCIGEVI